MLKQNLYIIAGCNGAGKTTASYTILPEIIECKEFVNADEIAKGLSPFQPETVSFEAGRIMINRINELIGTNSSFAFETTLSTRSYRNKIIEAKNQNYTVTLLFFWLSNVKLAKERVRIRVKEGGHNVNGALIFDNSYGRHELIAHKMGVDALKVIDAQKFNQLKESYDREG